MSVDAVHPIERGYGAEWRYIGSLAQWHDDRHDIPDDADSDAAIDVPPQLMAGYLYETMRPNPQSTWCKTRGCSHLALKHRAGVCMVDGCGCDELRED